MNLDFLILPQSFQKGVSDTNASATARKNDFSVKERDEVKTFKSKNSGETEQDKSFDDFMQNLRKKSQEDSVQNKKSSEDSADKTKATTESAPAKDLFQTRLAANLPVGESDLSTEDKMLDSIAALNAEIARLINLTTEEQTKVDGEQPESIPEESSPELIAVANETIKTQDEIRNIFALFANLVEQTENTGGGNDAEISAILDKIRGLVEAEDGSLITSGYTPEQLTELQKLMQDLVREQVSRRDLKMLEALAAQWVTLAPPPVKTKEGESLDLSKQQPLQQQNDIQGSRPQETLPTTQDGNAVLPEKNHAQSRYDARYDLQDSTIPDDAPSQGGTDFKSVLKNAEGKSTQETHTLVGNNNAPIPAQKFLQGLGLQSDGLVVTTPETASSLLQTQSGVGHTSLTTQNILTNVAAHAPQAGQPHPATQAVVATIQKALKEGEDTSIKLRLDPPELGRVEVKMSIGKDNVTKIVLTAEKPETYMMLQRDAQILERALQDSGLNADSGLSFELASQNHDFDGHNNRRGGGHDNGGTGRGTGEDIADNETIETVMNWKIDPRTGQMHYNVLV